MCLFKKNKYPLGLLGKDPKDIRDFQLAEAQPERVSLPASYLLIDKMLSVQRQFWGTCTSHMADGIKEFQEGVKLSQRFIYYNSKKLSGLWNTEGEYLRNTLKSVTKYGVPLEEDFPDSKDGSWENYIKKEPALSVYEKAEKYKGKSYFRVGKTIEDFMQAIFQNKCPVATGMGWYQSYYGIKSDGKLPLPSGKRYGGHAISCVGWEGEKLWFRNSHGANWGKDGYFYILFEEFEKHEIWDCWVLIDLEPLKGWVAEKYITKVKKFKVGEKVQTLAKGLRIRETPMGKIIGKFGIDETGTILEDENNGIIKNGYRWWKIGLTNN